MRLQSTLDNEIHIAVQRFVQDGVPADVGNIYSAIQKSNSSLKRKPKKPLVASIERVLDLIQLSALNEDDSQEELEKRQQHSSLDVDLMNKSLRSNLSAAPAMTGDEVPKKRRMANGEPLSKRQKSDRIETAPPSITFNDIGGMDHVGTQMKELLALPLLRPARYHEMNLALPRGVLLHGPPGCGKTMISRAFAARLGVSFVEILGPSIVSSMSGDSEKGIRERFEEAKRSAPSIIFIDELDSIAPKRDSSQSQMEKRIVAQLLVCMDELGNDFDKPVIVLAATNRPDTLDPALRRGGRFDVEITIPVPNEGVREQILRAMTISTPLAEDIDFQRLAQMTAGFVGADLKDLVSRAGSWELKQYRDALQQQATDLYPATMSTPRSDGLLAAGLLIDRLRMTDMPEPAGFENTQISMEAFLTVLPFITPSSKREGFATIPDVSWDDIGALEDVRRQLQIAIVRPIQQPGLFKAIGLKASSGVLLWGPPGCGKTLLAKAAAAESKANFISVKGPELLNKYVGESEAAVRRVFQRARSSVPCVIFFDEIDALTPKRDDASSEATSRVVNTLLSELDGLDERAGIYIIGATNRPDIIDNAMLRPGRLDKPLFIDLPSPNERVKILKTLVRGKPIDGVDDILEIARNCDGFSGADLGALLHSAGESTIMRSGTTIARTDFEEARKSVTGSVTDIQRYYKLKKVFGRM